MEAPPTFSTPSTCPSPTPSWPSRLTAPSLTCRLMLQGSIRRPSACWNSTPPRYRSEVIAQSTRHFVTFTKVCSNLECPYWQVESIENPLGSYSRLEADNGVHMRVDYLLIGALLLHLCFYPSFWFQWPVFFSRLYYKIKTTGNRAARMLARSLSAVNMRAVGSCTPPPTTSRSAWATWVSQRDIPSFLCTFWMITSLTGTWAFPHWRQTVHLRFPWLWEEVCHRSDVIHDPMFLNHTWLYRNNCGYGWLQGTDWRATHARTRGRSHTDAKSWTAASPSKHLETFRSTQGLTQVCSEKSCFQVESHV